VPVYRDDNVAGIALGVSANAPDPIAWNSTAIYVRAFDGNATTEQIFGAMEINHDYKEGTDLYPHVHWAPTDANSGNVVWQLTYEIREGTTVAETDTITVTDAAGGTAWEEMRADFDAIDGTGITIGYQFVFRLFRDPGHASDTYAHDAALLTFGLHYQVDGWGSRSLTAK
jgi:hypothetical protein